MTHPNELTHAAYLEAPVEIRKLYREVWQFYDFDMEHWRDADMDSIEKNNIPYRKMVHMFRRTRRIYRLISPVQVEEETEEQVHTAESVDKLQLDFARKFANKDAFTAGFECFEAGMLLGYEIAKQQSAAQLSEKDKQIACLKEQVELLKKK